MRIYRKSFQLDPASFIPFNDSPFYLSGSVSVGERDTLLISGTSRYQLANWYGIGGRTRSLRAHSFVFSANVVPKSPLGAYQLRITGDPFPSIGLSHVIRCSATLYQENLKTNVYSGFAYDNNDNRTNTAVYAPWEPIDRRHALAVGYSARSEELFCLINGFPLHRISAKLDTFSLQTRLEAVGIDGSFEVIFENLCYYSLDDDLPDNILTLRGWDPNYAPVFVSYSHQDKGQAYTLLDVLRSSAVRVLGDWGFKIGDSLMERISGAILRSGFLIALLSENSVASKWVQKELEIAITRQLKDKNIRVLPIIIDDCEIPPFLEGTVYLDLRQDDQRVYEKLLETIRSFGVW